MELKRIQEKTHSQTLENWLETRKKNRNKDNKCHLACGYSTTLVDICGSKRLVPLVNKRSLSLDPGSISESTCKHEAMSSTSHELTYTFSLASVLFGISDSSVSSPAWQLKMYNYLSHKERQDGQWPHAWVSVGPMIDLIIKKNAWASQFRECHA